MLLSTVCTDCGRRIHEHGDFWYKGRWYCEVCIVEKGHEAHAFIILNSTSFQEKVRHNNLKDEKHWRNKVGNALSSMKEAAAIEPPAHVNGYH